MREIEYWHRRQRCMETERVQDVRALSLLYETAIGRFFTNLVLSKRVFSIVYAIAHDGRRSVRRIGPFIREFEIDADQFEPGPYRSFNEFFRRRFLPSARSFAGDPSLMPAFAEGRYLAWEKTSVNQRFPVKGRRLPCRTLLASDEWAQAFEGGPVVICRLAPQDYHRVHFADSGSIIEIYHVAGALHSVNPLALQAKPDILCTNSRDVTIQRSANFGLIAYVEIGAMTVGRITQCCSRGGSVQRGEEKSYFQIGGSTVVVLGEKGRWRPDNDILEHTARGLETFVELGTAIGK